MLCKCVFVSPGLDMAQTFSACKRFLRRSTSSAFRNIFPSRVIVSKSNDIFSNLALEDWIYNRAEKTGVGAEGLMLLWRNDPCVVVGRHQNIWVETDVCRCPPDGVAVARRRSGGGAVYHDRGNVNLTFFTDRKHYDRKRNLCLISAALNSRWNLQVVVTSRDDLMLDNKYKVITNN